MRLRALLLSSLVVCALAAVACGAAGDAPNVSGLVAQSIRSVSAQKDVKVHYDVTATIDAKPSAQATEDTRQYLSSPITLNVSGGASQDAVTMAGSVGFTGKTFHAQALFGRHEEFINVLGRWYGDRTKGLADAQDDATGAAGSQADQAQVKQALRWVYQHADQVFDGKVSEGPDVDGDTWQAEGHCKPDGIAKFAQDNGQPLNASDRQDLDRFCQLTDITYVVGADDHLPRELKISADFDKQALAALADSSDDDSAKELDHMKMALDIKLTKWGEPVTYSAPSNAKSMDDLGKAILGLFFQATA